MSSRYDFVKDPKERQWIARWQVASVVMFIGLIVALLLYGPPAERAVAGAGPAQAGQAAQRNEAPGPERAPLEPRVPRYAEGA